MVMVPTVPAAVALGMLVDDTGFVWTKTVLAQAMNVPEKWLETLLD